MVCATSQAVNDWYDRDVDAINQPERPIPSGRLPGPVGLVPRVALDRIVTFAGDRVGPGWIRGGGRWISVGVGL